MYAVSDAYKKAIQDNTRSYYWTGKITLADGTGYPFENEDIVKGSGYVTRQCCGSNEIELGTVYAAELGITLLTDIDRYSLTGATITLSFHLDIGNGVYEEVPMGIFEISEANRTIKCLEIKAYDYMLRFDADFDEKVTNGVAYSQYNSTSDSVRLTYEVYLFSTGDIFLNVLHMPTDSSYLGTNQLICTGGTKAFTVTAGRTLQETFTHANDSGTDFTAAAGLINIQAPYDRKYLITDKGGKIYTVVTTEGILSLSEIENPGEISKALFEAYGVDDMPPGSLLLPLTDPVLLFWQDSQDPLPMLEADVTAVPFPQTVITEEVDMTDSTILGIEKVTADSDDNTLFAVSFDDGTTWWNYVNNAWAVLSEEQSGMTKAALADISTDAWALKATTGHYMFRFVLFEGSYVNSIVVDYLN